MNSLEIKIRAFFAAALLFLAGACSGWPELVSPVFAPSNLSDYEFTWQTQVKHLQPPKHGLVATYQGLHKILYARCRNAPSDSQFLVAAFELSGNCNAIVPLLSSISRVFQEHDLAFTHAHRPFAIGDRLVWPSFPKPCSRR